MSTVLTNKLADLKECIDYIRADWDLPSDVPFEQDRRKQQLITLNLQHAFENLLDMANHLVRINKLGWPSNSAETFDLLEKAGLITAEMKSSLQDCIGMRNILVHKYKKTDLNEVRNVVEDHLDEISEAGKTLFSLGPDSIVSQAVPAPENDSLKPR